MMEKFFSIQELADLSGVSVRTIRFYLSEGLLPSPSVRGRYTDYDESYLHRLRLIQKLKDAHLPLREIRRQMQNLPADSIRVLAEREELNLNQLLPPEPQVSMQVSDSAVEYISRVLDNQAVFNRLDDRVRPEPPPAALSSRQPFRKMQQAAGGSEEQWRRIPLADGVELHVREPLSDEMSARMRKLMEMARGLFSI